MTTDTAQLADSQHPWIGLASFTESDREFFAGRGEEIDELLRLVRRDILTLLYGVSGLGKTSLLQAGLFPALRAEDCLPIPIRLDYREGAAPLTAQVLGAIIAAADAARVEAPQPRPDETLWEYLHREGNHFWSPHNDLVTPFLAFDQFEELFTLGRETPECVARTTAFISELADLAENRPPAALRDDPLGAKEFSFKPAPLKVLLVMREDYLAELDRIRSHFRALGQNRQRLLPMGERQARQVIALGAPLLAAGVEDRILKFVAGGDDDAEITIAPALLSLVLRELNERRLARGPDAKITPDLLDVEQQKIFEDFYLRTIENFPVGVRTFIEDKLLTTTGYRDSCALDDALSCQDVTQPILNELVNRRLLAYEDRHNTRRVELTHDVLIPVIKASRDARLTREALAKAEQQQREAYEKERVARRRLAVVAVLLVLAVAGAIYGWVQAHRADQAAQQAKEQARIATTQRLAAQSSEKKADAARGRAEQQTQLATARQLAAQAEVGAVRTPRNLLLALESISITQKIGTFSPTASRQLLADLLNTTGGIPLQHAAPVKAVGFSPDDRWLAAASAGVVQLWDMQAPSTAPVTLGGQNKVVNALAFSPDGRTLAIVGDDTGVRLWDMATVNRAASARVLETHNAHLVDVAFSRNGRWLATASRDGAAQLWDLAAADPATANSILPHDKGVNTLAFSPDNRWLTTGSSDGTVRMWDLLSPNPSGGPIPLHVNMDIRKVAFSPNSQWLVAGATGSYTVLLMRVAAPDQPFHLKVDQYVLAVAFSPDGRWLATPSAYDVRLWDLNKPDPSSEPLILPGHKNFIADLAFSPDGKWFATGSADHTVQLWNVAERFTAPAVLRGHEGPISGLAFSHDSQHLATASADQTVRLWNTSSPAAEPLMLRTPDGATEELHLWDTRAVDLPEAPRVLGGKLNPGAGSVFSPDGQWIATIPAGGVDYVDLWKLSTPSPTHYRVLHPGGIWAPPVFSPDGRWLATGGVRDPTIRLWDLKSPNPQSDPRLLRGHRGPVRSLAFSADGHRLVSGARDGFALVWDLTADPPPSPKRLAGGDIKAVAISADGRHVVTGSWEPDYDARIWDLSSPFSSSNPIKLIFEGRVFDVAISPDGRWVAAGSWDPTTQTQLLDLSKPGTKPFVLKGHTARTLSVAFSPDSQWLATGNEDQTARLWNLAAADPSLDSTVLQAAYKVGSVSFSPDGRWLALNLTEYRTNPFSPDGNRFVSSSSDTRLYHVRLEDLIGLACRTAGRNLTKTEWELSFGDQPYRKTCPQLPSAIQ